MNGSEKVAFERLDGNLFAKAVLSQIAQQAEKFKEAYRRSPKFVLVGSFESKDSPGIFHANLKKAACEKSGVDFSLETLPWAQNPDSLAATVERLNRSEEVDAIFVQTPFPFAIDGKFDLSAAKDIDAQSTCSLGALLSRGTQRWDDVSSADAPAVVTAALELLRHNAVNIAKERAIILVDSKSAKLSVGPCLFLALAGEGAIVSLINIDEVGPERSAQICKEAMIVVTTGLAVEMAIDSSWIKSGSCLVDLGQHLIPAENEKGYRVVGDFAPSALKVCKCATPTPGGLGPATVAILLRNVLVRAESRARTEIKT